jgi:RNA polymerase sigma-70 factor (ECF subfamily)
VALSGSPPAASDAHPNAQPSAQPGTLVSDPFWPEGLTFERVLERARAHELEALSLIYRRFLPVVYRFVLSRVADVPLAEDLTSETFFAIVAGIAGVRAQDELGFATWALGIARHKLSQHFRHLKSRHEIPMALAEGAEGADPSATAEADDPLAVITARESWAEVVAALNHLTAEQRTVLLQRCILGRATEDVARIMGKPANAIYGLQFRALGSLARQLAKNDLERNESAGTESPGGAGRQPQNPAERERRRNGHAARGKA